MALAVELVGVEDIIITIMALIGLMHLVEHITATLVSWGLVLRVFWRNAIYLAQYLLLKITAAKTVKSIME